ncbi:probable LRR receptor-like serine/threonine-protein kinase At1g05700 [Zingiber officinale]|uniref:probable LRR receptor-like serine/threonine-protein kinase At1g05700 n=1 Tax=Zingiber officinale TaxID=94328 RepID=UPI001C4BAE48|nr:probable LRR receptor-like serine/threonine-protein kinase At1g05700 [Zingiber officinale]
MSISQLTYQELGFMEGRQIQGRKMTSRSCCFVLLFASVLMLCVHGQPPSTDGFISIDCGISSNHSYSDPTTQILYVSDDRFIDRGTDYNVSATHVNSLRLSAQLLNLRSFPDDERNCYSLPASQHAKYLVRAIFYYGNYDGRNSASVASPLSFDLQLEVNHWRTVNVTNASEVYSHEVITVAAASVVSACLINTGQGTPFVSAIELRPLKSSIYSFANVSQSLVLCFRSNYGSLDNEAVRYPKDKYDRIWQPTPPDPRWRNISTNFTVENFEQDEFEAPTAVMQTAFTPARFFDREMRFSWDYLEGTNKFFANLHFAELAINRSRQFNIFMNGELWYGPYEPPYLMSDAVYSVFPMEDQASYNFRLTATGNSSLPPLINAVEVYSPMQIEDTTNANDVDAITAIKVEYQVKRGSWTGDPCVPRRYAWDGLTCSHHTLDPPRITSINLSSSRLAGGISTSFASLSEIRSLDLSFNNLTGVIPDSLGNLTLLTFLDLRGNNITGAVPVSILQKMNNGTLTLLFDSYTNSEPVEASDKNKNTNVILISTVSPAVVILLLLVVLIAWRMRRNERDLAAVSAEESAVIQMQVDVHLFTYAQIVKITNNFVRSIGKGGFGIIYHGELEDGTQVAIKLQSQLSPQSDREFLAEARNLTRIHHKNLVSLVGYCKDGSYLALVYEYMPLGSLQENLRGKAHSPGLTWAERLHIAHQAAQGLDYLHRGCEKPIIHGDVKSSNILLGESLETKIADFGLSKTFCNEYDTDGFASKVVGTPGYIDPLYQSSLRLDEKIDVYSFGVVLQELVTGQPPVIPDPGRGHISKWLSERILTGKIDDFIDEKLQNGDYEPNSVWKVVDLAMRCTASSPGSRRPEMAEIVDQLQESIELERGERD